MKKKKSLKKTEEYLDDKGCYGYIDKVDEQDGEYKADDSHLIGSLKKKKNYCLHYLFRETDECDYLIYVSNYGGD